MADFSDFNVAAQAVANPTTPANDLAAIAAAQPTLQAQVANHPAAYPDLLDWLAGFGTEDAREAAASRLGETVAAATILAPPPPPAPMLAPQWPYPVRQNHRLAWIIGGGVAVVVAVALVLTFAVFLPNSNADRNFNTAVAAYQQAQSDLAAELSAAQTVAGYSDPSAMDAPDTLDKLNADIQSAEQNTATPAPAMAQSTAQIRQQTSDLQAKTTTMQTQLDALKSDVQAVQSSALAWAKAALTTAVSDANLTYTQYSYSPDTASLSSLQDEITQAQQVLDSLDQADPSTYSSVAQASINSLRNAQAAVVAAAPVKCGDLILPMGVDSMVCGGMPAGARIVTDTPYYGRIFEMPSKNIACYGDGSTVTCEIKNYSFATPSALQTACNNLGPDAPCNQDTFVLWTDGSTSLGNFGGCDGPMCYLYMGGKATILQYGQTADFSSFACLSASDGVTCWNINNHHGYKINASHFYYW